MLQCGLPPSSVHNIWCFPLHFLWYFWHPFLLFNRYKDEILKGHSAVAEAVLAEVKIYGQFCKITLFSYFLFVYFYDVRVYFHIATTHTLTSLYLIVLFRIQMHRFRARCCCLCSKTTTSLTPARPPKRTKWCDVTIWCFDGVVILWHCKIWAQSSQVWRSNVSLAYYFVRAVCFSLRVSYVGAARNSREVGVGLGVGVCFIGSYALS